MPNPPTRRRTLAALAAAGSAAVAGCGSTLSGGDSTTAAPVDAEFEVFNEDTVPHDVTVQVLGPDEEDDDPFAERHLSLAASDGYYVVDEPVSVTVPARDIYRIRCRADDGEWATAAVESLDSVGYVKVEDDAPPEVYVTVA